MRKYKGRAKCSCNSPAKWKTENNGNPKFRCNDHKNSIAILPDDDELPDDTIAADLTYKRLR